MYKYQMLLRPIGIGHQPDGHIEYEEKSKRHDGCWGILTYSQPLTEEEIYRYELKEVKNDSRNHRKSK